MDGENIFQVESYGNNCVEETTITYKWIIENLEKNSKEFRLKRKDSKIIKMTYEDISKGKGVGSNVMRLTICFDNNNSYEVILKIPILENAVVLNELGLKDTKEFDTEMVSNTIVTYHSQEHIFYREIAKLIKDFKVLNYYGGCDIIPFKQNGVIIMDYVNINEGEIIDVSYPLNIYQAKSVIKEIFKLHVFSLSDNKDWKNKIKNVRNVELFTFLQQISMAQWETCKKLMPQFFIIEIEEDMMNLLSNLPEIGMYNTYHLNQNEEDNKVICHGDLWINNILFCKDSEGRFTNDVRGIVDWQIVHEGSIGSDLSRHLAVNCTPEIRRELEISYLPQYFDKLKKEVLKKNKYFNMTYETFRRNYDFCYIESIFLIIVTVGYKISQLDMSKESESIWEAIKFTLSSRIYFGIKDAIERVKILKPEWLIKKDKNI